MKLECALHTFGFFSLNLVVEFLVSFQKNKKNLATTKNCDTGLEFLLAGKINYIYQNTLFSLYFSRLKHHIRLNDYRSRYKCNGCINLRQIIYF